MLAERYSERLASVGFLFTATFFSTSLLADDLTGADLLLCYGSSAAICSIDGGCETTTPWHLNMPDFLKLDLDAGLATSTGTAPEERETELRSIEREDGTIILQGTQENRAFSWLIAESTGEGTLTLSTPAEGITIFTLCTSAEDL